MQRGFLIIITGPASIGKDAVSSLICADSSLDITPCISYTTRPIGEFEAEGRDYHFVSRERFEQMKRDGEFLEVYEFEDALYGTSREVLNQLLDQGKNVLCTLSPTGAAKLLTLFDGPRTLSIYITLTNADAFRHKLTTYGKTRIEERIAIAQQEASLAPRFDCTIISSSLQLTADQVRTMIHTSLQNGHKDPTLTKGTVFKGEGFLNR